MPHPSTPEAYERWLDQCVAWGVETFEHDWLVEVFFGVRQMRSEPGRATEWQEGIDSAARDRGITLQWCMGTPADFAQTTTLTQVTSVRTSGDHGYIASAGQLWAWFCTTNALARSLDLMPFKDVFRADPDVAGQNGEPEALLSALSTGPVGVGDRVGRMDPALALRTCRADGLLVKPHTAIAATDESMLSGPAFTSTLLVAECAVGPPCRPVDLRGGDARQPGRRADRRRDPAGVAASTRGRRRCVPEAGAERRRRRGVGLAKRDGDATRDTTPQFPCRSAGRTGPSTSSRPCSDPVWRSIGDVTKFVTAGDARIEIAETSTGVRLVVKGAGEAVTVTGWAEVAPTSPDADVVHDPSTGVWTAVVEVPEPRAGRPSSSTPELSTLGPALRQLRNAHESHGDMPRR